MVSPLLHRWKIHIKPPIPVRVSFHDNMLMIVMMMPVFLTWAMERYFEYARFWMLKIGLHVPSYPSLLVHRSGFVVFCFARSQTFVLGY